MVKSKQVFLWFFVGIILLGANAFPTSIRAEEKTTSDSEPKKVPAFVDLYEEGTVPQSNLRKLEDLSEEEKAELEKMREETEELNRTVKTTVQNQKEIRAAQTLKNLPLK